MFFTYLWRELRRRMRQAIFIVIGLALGIGLVITVTAASAGVKNAQASVLHSLYGVGTDITVTKEPTASSTNPTRRDVRSCAPQFGQTTPDRAACHPGDARQRRNAAPSCRPRFGRRKPTPTPLVQNRIKRCVA